MARDLNKVMVIGRLGADPEMRFTQSGVPVTQFRIAVNRAFRAGGEGDRREETDWFRITAWQKLAETCNQYLVKGKRVYVEGRLQTRTFQGQDGQTRYMTEIVANDVIFLDPATGALPPGSGQDEHVENDMEPDELPF